MKIQYSVGSLLWLMTLLVPIFQMVQITVQRRTIRSITVERDYLGDRSDWYRSRWKEEVDKDRFVALCYHGFVVEWDLWLSQKRCDLDLGPSPWIEDLIHDACIAPVPQPVPAPTLQIDVAPVSSR